MDVLIPGTGLVLRLQELMDQGKNRAKAYVNGDPVAANNFKQGQALQAESYVGYSMITLRDLEVEYKSRNGAYTCELSMFGYSANDPRNVAYRRVEWNTRLNTISSYGYRLQLQNCSAHHFEAFAKPSVADGSQGRAFCADESHGIYRVDDGRTSNCFLRGKLWQGN
jgi:hypothetical protein